MWEGKAIVKRYKNDLSPAAATVPFTQGCRWISATSARFFARFGFPRSPSVRFLPEGAVGFGDFLHLMIGIGFADSKIGGCATFCTRSSVWSSSTVPLRPLLLFRFSRFPGCPVGRTAADLSIGIRAFCLRQAGLSLWKVTAISSTSPPSGIYSQERTAFSGCGFLYAVRYTVRPPTRRGTVE